MAISFDAEDDSPINSLTSPEERQKIHLRTEGRHAVIELGLGCVLQQGQLPDSSRRADRAGPDW